jgi:hypothetical protein
MEVTMRTLHDPTVRDVLHERVDRLSGDAQGRWGTMSVDQMLWHLNTGLRSALGDVDFTPTDTAFSRNVIKWIVLFGPWPKGKVSTNREMIASEGYDVDEESKELKRLIEAVGGRDLKVSWPRNSVFGRMTGWQWSRLEFRHIDYHLKQFGA